jgi:hypothetical protein
VTTHLYSGETIGAWAYKISSTWVYSGTCLSVGRIVDFITAVDLVEIYYCQWILVDLHAKSVFVVSWSDTKYILDPKVVGIRHYSYP